MFASELPRPSRSVSIWDRCGWSRSSTPRPSAYVMSCLVRHWLKRGSFAIIGVGGFLVMGKHDVAIPVNHIKLEGDRLLLPGATKEALKALPEFQYAKTEKSKQRG